jgi:hypothetical protein
MVPVYNPQEDLVRSYPPLLPLLIVSLPLLEEGLVLSRLQLV